MLKIDLTRPFQPRPKNTAMAVNIMDATCAVTVVDQAETNDWAAAAKVVQDLPSGEYNRRATAGLRFGFFSITTPQDFLVKTLLNHGFDVKYP